MSKYINTLYKKYILDVADELIPTLRKKRFTNQYFLNMFGYVLKHCYSWSSLTLLASYPKGRKYKNHYKYINQVFNLWNDKNIFNIAYSKLLKDNYFKSEDVKKAKSVDLFIDCSYMINKCGVESMATNPEYRKKKVTKISLISDDYGTILGASYDRTHYNANSKNKRAFSHDTKLVQDTLDNMNLRLPVNVVTKIGGDKGYITPLGVTGMSRSTQESFELNNGKAVKIIAPKRKNQKIKNTMKEKKYLEKRGVVVAGFAATNRNDQ
jgi:hypothetical protein